MYAFGIISSEELVIGCFHKEREIVICDEETYVYIEI